MHDRWKVKTREGKRSRWTARAKFPAKLGDQDKGGRGRRFADNQGLRIGFRSRLEFNSRLGRPRGMNKIRIRFIFRSLEQRAAFTSFREPRSREFETCLIPFRTIYGVSPCHRTRSFHRGFLAGAESMSPRREQNRGNLAHLEKLTVESKTEILAGESHRENLLVPSILIGFVDVRLRGA